MKKNNKINKINYTLFIFLFVATIVSAVIIFMLYSAYKTNNKEISAISGEVVEIRNSNLTEYINENSNIFLYLNKSSNEKRDYEIEMLKISKEKNIPIIFLDMDNISDTKNFIKKMNNKYKDKISIKKYPALLLIKDNTIIGIVEEKNNTLSTKEINNLFLLSEME